MDFADVMGTGELPTRFAEANRLRDYVERGSPNGEPIYLSLGEAWSETAPGLVGRLSPGLPSHSHGYIISQHGLPRLHRVLRDYLARTHGISDTAVVGRDYEVAVTCAGTRNAMFDFARHLAAGSASRRAALVFTPGWDYSTVLASAGFETFAVPLRVENGFHPTDDDIQAALAAITIREDIELGLVVINAQHNPTGVNWRPADVRGLIRVAFDAGAAVLADDAYYAVHDPHVAPTSTLRVLTEESGPGATWLAVRSLGKQFNCNGWGIGAMTGPVHVIDQLVNDVHFQRSFITAVPLQEAMAAWLLDPASERYLRRKRHELSRKRNAVVDALARGFGYPHDGYARGECTPYVRFRPPPEHQGGTASVQAFRDRLFADSGVLLGLDPSHGEDDSPWLRMFIGPPLPIIHEALGRLSRAGLRHGAPVPAGG